MKSNSFTNPLSIVFCSILIPLFCFFPLRPAMGQEIKIGGVFPLTGSQAFVGTSEKNAAQMAVDEINAAGGIKGQKVQFVAYDDTGDPSKTVLIVKKLTEVDNVPVIIGPGNSPTTMAVIPIVEKAEITIISEAYSTAVTSPVRKWVFKTGGDSLTEVQVYARDYLVPMGIKKLAVLYVSNPLGEDGRDSIQKVAAENKIGIVREESFKVDDMDMTAQLTRIKASDTQVLIVWGTNPAPAIIAKNRKQIGLRIPLIQLSGVMGPVYMKLAGDAANGVLTGGEKVVVANLLPDDYPDKKRLLRFIDAYVGKYGKEASINPMVGYGYDAAMIAAEAIKKVGTDRVKVRDAIENTKGFLGISGTYSYSPTDHKGLTTEEYLFMIEIVDGKLVRWKKK